MFTTSTGPTNVASNGDTVGLLIGGSQLGGLTVPDYLAAAAELVANGGFDADSNWSKGTGWSIVAGVASHAAGSAGNLDQGLNTTANILYRLRLTVSGRTSGAITPSFSSSFAGIGGSISANGTYDVFVFGVGSTILRISADSSFNGSIDNVSLKAVAGYHTRQTTSGDRPQYQSGYLRGDGSSDNLLTTWVCGSGDNTVISKFVVPASIVSIPQFVFGTMLASSARFSLAVDTSGHVCAGAGSNGTSTVVGTTDLRGSAVVIALSFTASTVKLFAYKAGVATEEYSGSPSGTPNTTIPARLLALNVNGTSSNMTSGDVGRTIAAQKAMSLAEFTAIAPLLAA
jgi:hypothetical protein